MKRFGALQKNNNPIDPFLIDVKDAIEIVEIISLTFDSEVGQEWDKVAYQSSMEYLQKIHGR